MLDIVGQRHGGGGHGGGGFHGGHGGHGGGFHGGGGGFRTISVGPRFASSSFFGPSLLSSWWPYNWGGWWNAYAPLVSWAYAYPYAAYPYGGQQQPSRDIARAIRDLAEAIRQTLGTHDGATLAQLRAQLDQLARQLPARA